MAETQTGFTNAQVELINLFSLELDEEQLAKLKKLLLQFRADELSKEADRIWNQKGFSKEMIDDLIHQKLRTPYKKLDENSH